jgi:hypothetical protein
VDAVFVEEPSDGWRAGAPGVAREEGLKGGRAAEPECFGAFGGARELVFRDDGGEVEEGAGGGGDRDAGLDRDLVGREGREAGLNAGAVVFAGDGDLDLAARRVEDAPTAPRPSGGSAPRHVRRRGRRPSSGRGE